MGESLRVPLSDFQEITPEKEGGITSVIVPFDDLSRSERGLTSEYSGWEGEGRGGERIQLHESVY